MSANLRVLAPILLVCIQEYDWVIGGVVTRAKSTLAASAIVLGVMIAGIGGFAWLLNAGHMADAVVAHLRSVQGVWAVLAMGVLGFCFMLGAACLSAWALRVVRVKSPFSSKLIMLDEKIDKDAMEAWKKAEEAVLYENICKSYAAALRSREVAVNNMGPKALLGQVCLVIGLSLTAIAAILMLVSLGTVLSS